MAPTPVRTEKTAKNSGAGAAKDASDAALEKEATDEDPREHLNIVFIGHGEVLPVFSCPTRERALSFSAEDMIIWGSCYCRLPCPTFSSPSPFRVKTTRGRIETLISIYICV